MTTKEIKTQIQKALDEVPDIILKDILDYLQSIQNKPADALKLSHNFRQIIIQDKELLEKLAK